MEEGRRGRDVTGYSRELIPWNRGCGRLTETLEARSDAFVVSLSIRRLTHSDFKSQKKSMNDCMISTCLWYQADYTDHKGLYKLLLMLASSKIVSAEGYIIGERRCESWARFTRSAENENLRAPAVVRISYKIVAPQSPRVVNFNWGARYHGQLWWRDSC